MKTINLIDRHKILRKLASEVVFGIGSDGMEIYLSIDGDGEHYIGSRQKGSFGKIDNSFVFMTIGIDTLDWNDKIYKWFDSIEQFYSIRDELDYPLEHEIFSMFLDEVYDDILSLTEFYDYIDTRFKMLELLRCETIQELGEMLLSDYGFDIWDLDYEQLILHDRCFVVDEKYLIDLDIIEWTEEIDDTVIEVLGISEI